MKTSFDIINSDLDQAQLIALQAASLNEVQKNQEAVVLASVKARLAEVGKTVTGSAPAPQPPIPDGPTNGEYIPFAVVYNADGSINWNATEDNLRQAIAYLQANPESIDDMMAIVNMMAVFNQPGGAPLPPDISNLLSQDFGSQTLANQIISTLVYAEFVQVGNTPGGDGVAAANKLMNEILKAFPPGSASGAMADFANAAQMVSSGLAQWITANSFTNPDGSVTPAYTIWGMKTPIDFQTFLEIQCGPAANTILNNSNLSEIYNQIIQDRMKNIEKMTQEPLLMMMLLMASLSDDSQIQLGGISGVTDGLNGASNLVSSLLNAFRSSGSLTGPQAMQFFNNLKSLQVKIDSDPRLASLRPTVDSAINYFKNLKDVNGNTLLSDFQTGNSDALAAGLNQYSPTGSQSTAWQQGLNNLSQMTTGITDQSSATTTLEQSKQNSINSNLASIKSLFDSMNSWEQALVQAQQTT